MADDIIDLAEYRQARETAIKEAIKRHPTTRKETNTMTNKLKPSDIIRIEYRPHIGDPVAREDTVRNIQRDYVAWASRQPVEVWDMDEWPLDELETYNAWAAHDHAWGKTTIVTREEGK